MKSLTALTGKQRKEIINNLMSRNNEDYLNLINYLFHPQITHDQIVEKLYSFSDDELERTKQYIECASLNSQYDDECM